MNTERFHGKAAIVTDGGRGLGCAIAGRLASEDASILIADIDGAEAAAQALGSSGAVVAGCAEPGRLKRCLSR